MFASFPGLWKPWPPFFFLGSWEARGFEVTSTRLPDGTSFEVGKSSEARVDILERFRARASVAFAVVLALALAGGALATREALAPVRRLATVLGDIVRTGKVSARVQVRGRRRSPGTTSAGWPTRCWTAPLP